MLRNFFSTNKTTLIQIGSWFAIRIKQLFLAATGISSVILLHKDLLHLGETWNDGIILVCLILMSLNHSVVETK